MEIEVKLSRKKLLKLMNDINQAKEYSKEHTNI